MKKFCIIGNSHIGCIKKAYDEVDVDTKNNFNFVLEFYGSPSSSLLSTCLSGNQIIPTDDKVSEMFELMSGKVSINIEEYDYFIIHGLFDVTQHLKLQSKIQLYSNAVYAIAFENLLGQTLKHVINLLVSYKKNLKIIVSPRPAVPSIYSSEVYANETFIDNEKDYFSYFSKKNIFYLSQPKDTLVNYFYTDIELLKNGLNFSDKEDGNVGDHGNIIYGKSYLSSLINYINDL